MSDRPTPRTDAAVFISRGMGMVPTLPKEAVMADFARQLERELAEAHAENLEQARLLGMSAEREADLRGELEREKRRADGLRYELAATREQRDEALNLLRRIARKSAFMDREGLRLVVSDWLARRYLSENVKRTCADS